MNSGRKLGRGLSSLLTTRHAEDEGVPGGPQWVAIEHLVPNRKQPRADVEKGLERLAESIRRHGVMQPIVVTPLAPDKFEIIAGERRWRAAAHAGLKSVPVILRPQVSGDEERLELALIENVQREDLNAIERARACRQLLETYQLTQEDVAGRLGLERSTIANLIRLLELPEAIQDVVSRGTLSAGHARALLRLNGHPQQARLMEQMIREDWSVRQAEEACGRLAQHPAKPAHAPRPRQPAWIQGLQEQITRGLGVRAEVRLLRKGGGKLILHFAELESLDALARRLGLRSEAEELLGPG
ncbi:MAG: ParB/RepB/Spo0J family partition protein [Planctomycetota bacterium]|nr:MAG: ParB/RepB/Spo0J family partition protein [Planctomycetota bacterium]